MPVHNSDIAAIFNKTADLLEIKGENAFRVRAYRNAARSIDDLAGRITDMIREGKDLSNLPGIGKDLAGKIETIEQTGKLPLLQQLEDEFPEGIHLLLRVEGLGPKKVKKLYEELNISDIDSLKKALRNARIRELPGFGEKTEENIRRSLETFQPGESRVILMKVEELVEDLSAYLEKEKNLHRITVAGSYRRNKETVGDIDILATSSSSNKGMDHFVRYEDVDRVVSKGTTRSTVILRSGLQVDLRIVEPKSYGAALYYFTGSKEHNVAVRKRGVDQGLKINEYGVFKGDEQIAGREEKDIFEQIGLPFIEPELRENRGEIEAAEEGRLPDLITLDDIRGDLHVHTTATDGKDSMEEMAKAAQKRGYSYLAVCDHSRHVSVAGGLDENELAKQIDAIDELNEGLESFRLIKGIEVDILEDGTLDLPDDILKRLDLRVCSLHYKFNLSEKKQTKRVLTAMENPYFNIFAHPTGRLLGEREPYAIDIDAVMDKALETGSVLELNAYPQRLDLNDIHLKAAKEKGLKIVISTDAHSTNGLSFMKYGISQARRGWIEKDDVLNTRDADSLLSALSRD
jgi:DNA polymerase (family X)